jgi:CheY-like chemotaxis protein
MPGARILLVEDDEVLCDVVVRNLQARDHEVQVARDGQTAQNLLRASAFDLIVLDINLPDETGWEVLRVAQREGWLHLLNIDGDTQKLPVVVVSAVRVSSSRLQEFAPLAYLPKPFALEALLRLASEAAGRRDASSESGRVAVSDLEKLESGEEDLYA